MHTLIQQDLEQLAQREQVLLQQLQNKTVFVTGATGLIGSQIVFLFLILNRLYHLNINILALVRNADKARALFGQEHSQLQFIQGDILQIPTITQPIDYIIHGASVTSSLDFVTKPVDTIAVALQGTTSILELAKQKHIQSMVYLSSLEVYGVVNQKDIYEQDFGYIDFTNVRSSYSEGKRMAECLSISYAQQYQVPVKIARLGQTFGAGVDYQDNRVFAQFARAVIEKKNIVLHTTGETERNYCYTSDAISAILYILLKGENAQAYNVANEATMISIREMAELAASLDDTQTTKVVIDIQDAQSLGYNPVVKIKLKTTKLEQLGWQATTDLKTMLSRLIAFM
ncbi:MAG: NAD(P)-dependent oxidoreductase, partial [Acinetobacter sp.]|nr:NAD(P)-dependent oxidoreductase [Acinetobacter sp.]